MFNNLIESSSHTKEFKRRGSFLLFTIATYFVLFTITGIASIYAYDAHLEEQNMEFVTLLTPQDFAPDKPAPTQSTDHPKTNPTNDRSMVPERAVAMLDVNHPEVVPVGVSAKPNTNLPLPPGNVKITGEDWNPPAIGDGKPSHGGQSGSQRTQVIMKDDPPPPPDPTPAPAKSILKISEVLNSRAISLPRPPYPIVAKQIHLQGTVIVQVLIDESGKVLSAKAVSGNAILVPDAQRAALQARFSPTTINGQAVKVSGVISYNFQLQ